MAHEYKVGDYVRICARVGSARDYRFGFADPMLDYVGKVFQIKIIEDAYDTVPKKRPDDGKLYILKNVDYNWASSMFEYVPDEKVQIFHVGDKVKVLPRKNEPNLYTNSYVDSMLEYIGRTAVITQCVKRLSSYKDDGFSYRISVDEGEWWWSSNALELVATTSLANSTETNKTAKPSTSKSETTEEILKVLEVRIEDDDRRYKLNFNI